MNRSDVEGQQVAHVGADGKHPLAYGHARQDVVDQVRRGVRPTPAPGDSCATHRAGERRQVDDPPLLPLDALAALVLFHRRLRCREPVPA